MSDHHVTDRIRKKRKDLYHSSRRITKPWSGEDEEEVGCPVFLRTRLLLLARSSLPRISSRENILRGHLAALSPGSSSSSSSSISYSPAPPSRALLDPIPLIFPPPRIVTGHNLRGWRNLSSGCRDGKCGIHRFTGRSKNRACFLAPKEEVNTCWRRGRRRRG